MTALTLASGESNWIKLGSAQPLGGRFVDGQRWFRVNQSEQEVHGESILCI